MEEWLNAQKEKTTKKIETCESELRRYGGELELLYSYDSEAAEEAYDTYCEQSGAKTAQKLQEECEDLIMDNRSANRRKGALKSQTHRRKRAARKRQEDLAERGLVTNDLEIVTATAYEEGVFDKLGANQIQQSITGVIREPKREGAKREGATLAVENGKGAFDDDDNDQPSCDDGQLSDESDPSSYETDCTDDDSCEECEEDDHWPEKDLQKLRVTDPIVRRGILAQMRLASNGKEHEGDYFRDLDQDGPFSKYYNTTCGDVTLCHAIPRELDGCVRKCKQWYKVLAVPVPTQSLSVSFLVEHGLTPNYDNRDENITFMFICPTEDFVTSIPVSKGHWVMKVPINIPCQTLKDKETVVKEDGSEWTRQEYENSEYHVKYRLKPFQPRHVSKECEDTNCNKDDETSTNFMFDCDPSLESGIFPYHTYHKSKARREDTAALCQGRPSDAAPKYKVKRRKKQESPATDDGANECDTPQDAPQSEQCDPEIAESKKAMLGMKVKFLEGRGVCCKNKTPSEINQMVLKNIEWSNREYNPRTPEELKQLPEQKRLAAFLEDCAYNSKSKNYTVCFVSNDGRFTVKGGGSFTTVHVATASTPEEPDHEELVDVFCRTEPKQSRKPTLECHAKHPEEFEKEAKERLERRLCWQCGTMRRSARNRNATPGLQKFLESKTGPVRQREDIKNKTTCCKTPRQRCLPQPGTPAAEEIFAAVVDNFEQIPTINEQALIDDKREYDEVMNTFSKEKGKVKNARAKLLEDSCIDAADKQECIRIVRRFETVEHVLKDKKDKLEARITLRKGLLAKLEMSTAFKMAEAYNQNNTCDRPTQMTLEGDRLEGERVTRRGDRLGGKKTRRRHQQRTLLAPYAKGLLRSRYPAGGK